jgi:hypothetical protein
MGTTVEEFMKLKFGVRLGISGIRMSKRGRRVRKGKKIVEYRA